jgi:hypothetical protein
LSGHRRAATRCWDSGTCVVRTLEVFDAVGVGRIIEGVLVTEVLEEGASDVTFSPAVMTHQ